MKTARTVVTIFAALFLWSCVTTVNSKRVVTTDRHRGVRYYLPQPFLLVTPKADGLQVQKLMLPDLSAQYALDIQSYMTSYKSSVELENGMLKKVMLDLDNSKIATDVVTAAGEVAKAKVEQIGNTATAEQTKQTQVETQRQKLAMQIELKRQDIAFLEAQQPQNSSAIDQARRELDQLHLKLEFLEKTGNPQLFNVADKTSKPASDYLQQPGAVLYKVVQGRDSVRLVRVNKQPFLSTVAKSSPEGATSQKKPSAYKLGNAPGKIKAGEELRIPITITSEEFKLGSGTLSKGSVVVAKLEPVLDAEKKNIVMTIPQGIAAGSYKAEMTWSAKDNLQPGDPISLSIVVVE